MTLTAVIPGRASARTRNPATSSVSNSGFRVRRFTAPRNDRIVRIVALTFLCLALGAPAAADAEVKALGFSPDGRYFAFEQRGTDPAGVYAMTMAMAVSESRLVKGGAISYSDDDKAKLKKAETTTKRLIRRLRISPKDVRTISLRGFDFEPFEETSRKALALPSAWFGPETWLVLQQFKMAARCQGNTANPVGFGLALERKNAPAVQLAHDVDIPSSRGCPTHYRVVEAHTRKLKNGSTALAVIVQNFAPGFDAKNRNFIAVTALIPKN